MHKIFEEPTPCNKIYIQVADERRPYVHDSWTRTSFACDLAGFVKDCMGRANYILHQKRWQQDYLLLISLI